MGSFVGYKRKGRRRTKRLSIVCCVDKKVPRAQLPPADRLPRLIRWTEGRRFVRRIPIDVQEWGPSGRQAFFAGPADRLTNPVDGERATVGVAVDVPLHGAVMTTAAHAVIPGPGDVTFGDNPPTFTLTNVGASGPQPHANSIDVSCKAPLGGGEGEVERAGKDGQVSVMKKSAPDIPS